MKSRITNGLIVVGAITSVFCGFNNPQVINKGNWTFAAGMLSGMAVSAALVAILEEINR